MGQRHSSPDQELQALQETERRMDRLEHRAFQIGDEAGAPPVTPASDVHKP